MEEKGENEVIKRENETKVEKVIKIKREKLSALACHSIQLLQ